VASLYGPGMDGASSKADLFRSTFMLSMLIGASATWLVTASSQFVGRPTIIDGCGPHAAIASIGVSRGPAGAAATAAFTALGLGAAARTGGGTAAPSEGIFIRPPHFLHRAIRPASFSSTSKGAA